MAELEEDECIIGAFEESGLNDTLGELKNDVGL